MIIFFLIYLFLCVFRTCFLHLLGVCRGFVFCAYQRHFRA